VTETRFRAAIDAIDAANAEDPNVIRIGDHEGPKEILHAQRVTAWLEHLAPDASFPLRLAARAHHIRRWELPRDEYPTGTAGYHKWRRALQAHHARLLGEIMTDAGWDAESTLRAQAIVRKKGLRTDPDVQVFEDALCLTFLETQLTELAAKVDEAKMVTILRKTLPLMSDAGRTAARALELEAPGPELLAKAIAESGSESQGT
jgi:hypothetical protein